MIIWGGNYGVRKIWKEKFYRSHQNGKICRFPDGGENPGNRLQGLWRQILSTKGGLFQMLLKKYGLV